MNSDCFFIYLDKIMHALQWYYIIYCFIYFNVNSNLALISLLKYLMKLLGLRPHYVDPENQQNLVNFKYSGGTDSISYQYLWGPFAQKLLQYFPLWMAPNLITFASLVLLTVTHIVFMTVGSNEKQVAPWKLVLMASTILIYQHLDNVDGKQARRTKTGSPIGMLFDHGTDSIAAFFIAIQFLTIIQIKNQNIFVLVNFVFVMLIFFSALWHQYSTGVFKLGRVNPVDQGLPALAILCIVSIPFNFDVLNQFNLFAKLNQEILLCLTVILIFLLYSMNKNIFKGSIRDRDDVIHVLNLPISTGLLLAFMWFFDRNLFFGQVGLQMTYCLLFMWSRNMIDIQLNYIAKQRFRVFNRGTNIFIGLCFLYLIFYEKLNGMGISVQVYFWWAVVVNGLVFFQYVFNVLNQGARILNINILSIRDKKSI